MQKRLLSLGRAAIGNRHACTIALVVLYCLAFPALYRLGGASVTLLTALLVAALGWCFGTRVGLLAGLLGLGAETLLLTLTGQAPRELPIGDRASLEHAALLVASGLAGSLGHLHQRLRGKSREYNTIEQALHSSDTRFHELLRDLQVGVLVQDAHSRIVLVNKAALTLLGLSEEQVVGTTSFDPEWNIVRADGSPFTGEMHPGPQVIATGQPVQELVMGVYRADIGERVWLLVSAEPEFDSSGAVQHVVCTFINITMRVRAETALRRHDAIMGAVSFAATRFFESASWHEAIGEVLARLGAAAEVSRVYVFENEPGERVITSQRYEWVAPGVTPVTDKQLLHRFDYEAGGFIRWIELLARGEVVYGNVADFPIAEQGLLLEHGVQSILVVPVCVDQQWWGHLGFYQCDQPRAWAAADIDALKTAAGMLGAAIGRQRVEADLRENEQRYRVLFADAQRQARDLALLNQVRNDLSRALDPAEIFRLTVDAIAETFGYTQVSSYLLRDGELHLQHQVGYASVIERIPIHQGVAGRAVRTGEPILLEDVHQDSSFLGAISGIQSEICVPLIGAGQVIGILNVESIDDMTLQAGDLRLIIAVANHVEIALERATLHSQLRARELQYRSLVEQMNEVVFRINPAGQWVFLNPAWAEVTGFDVTATLGRRCTDHLHPNDVPAFEQIVKALLGGSLREWRDELRLRTAGGASCWAELRARPALAPDGTINGVAGTLTDVTASRRAEDERRALERKMLETQKLESLGVLAGGIAHDFNNLLMAILGNAELALLDLPAAHPAREAICQIQVTTRRAAELTGQMLAYAGRARFQIGPYDLNALVQEIATLLQVSVAKTTELRYNLAAQLPPLEGDATQIRQVVMNLVLNAAEAIGDVQGQITLTTMARHAGAAELAQLRLAPALPAGDYVMLEVRDTGAGMDEATQAKIFDPFFTTKFAGRGLGLAAVLGIVRSHRGGLHVRSAPGQGTVFSIFLPTSMAAGPVAPGAPEPPASLALTEGQPMRVLVVDDEEPVRMLVVKMLERAGYQAWAAADGRVALALLQNGGQPIGAAVIDLTMPHMNGEETLHALRAQLPGLPAVIMSGYDEYDLRDRFTTLAPVVFLQKPFSADALYSKLWQLKTREVGAL